MAKDEAMEISDGILTFMMQSFGIYLSRCILIIRFAEELTIDGDEETELVINPPIEIVL